MVVTKIGKSSVHVIEDGIVYAFDAAGLCTGEDVGNIAENGSYAKDLPICSILSSNGGVDIAFYDRGCFISFPFHGSSSEAAMLVQSAGRFVKMLRRNGRNFNQILFVYREDYDITSIKRRLEGV